MDKNEVLTKAIKKALQNGWLSGITMGKEIIRLEVHVVDDSVEITIDVGDPWLYTPKWNLHKMLFDHEFAKAFYGSLYDENYVDLWQFDLQQMVLEEDPLRYVERFVGGGE